MSKVKSYEHKAAMSSMDMALALVHGVKSSIEHTAAHAIAEEQLREMLALVWDVKATLAAIDGELSKELRDAVARSEEGE